MTESNDQRDATAESHDLLFDIGEAPPLHINNVNAYHGRLEQWLARFNGVAAKNLRTISARGAPCEPGATPLRRKTGSKAQSETGHTNR